MIKYQYLTTIVLLIFISQLFFVDISYPVPVTAIGEIDERHLPTVTSHADLLKPNPEAAYFTAATPEYEKILFTGDILLARHVETLMREKGDEYPFSGLSLRSTDAKTAVIGNFESSMLPVHQQTLPYQMNFSSSEDFIPALSRAGFTHLSLANNHSYDYGDSAFFNTVDVLRRHQLQPFGGPVPSESSITYLETSGGRIAIIGIDASEINLDVEAATKIIKDATDASDFQIIFVHWGDEYQDTHSQEQELLAEAFVLAGADLIVGHHPHVVQDIDIQNGVVVFYSLGNYIFDQYFSNEVMQGLVLELDVTGPVPRVLLLPVSSNLNRAQPALMSQSESDNFLKHLAERSAIALYDDILLAQIQITPVVATSTKMAMMGR